jgi:hypothetical protein
MKSKLTLIATVVATLFTGILPAIAANTHESEWGAVQLCDKLTIADDSTGEWGCWTDFAPPAAGPSGVGFMGMPSGEPYHNIPYAYLSLVIPPASGGGDTGGGGTGGGGTGGGGTGGGGTGGGLAYGYALYHNYGPNENGKGYLPASLVVDSTIGQLVGHEGDLTIESFVLAKLASDPLNGSDDPPFYTDTGAMLGSYQPWHKTGYKGSVGNEGAFAVGRVYPDGQVVVGMPEGSGGDIGFNIHTYVSGQGHKTQGTEGVYVVGYPTSATNMAAMNTLIGQYSGQEMMSGAAVNITANFSNAMWNGTWGSKGSLPAWGASGTINGANIQSTALTGAATAGTVQGTFYGPSAQNLAGISDVMLQKGDNTIRHTDLFVTTQTSINPAPQ